MNATAGEDLQSHGEEEMAGAGPSRAEGEPIEQDIYDGGDGFAGDDDDDGGAMQPLEPAGAMPQQGAEPPWCEGKQCSCIYNQCKGLTAQLYGANSYISASQFPIIRAGAALSV